MLRHLHNASDCPVGKVAMETLGGLCIMHADLLFKDYSVGILTYADMNLVSRNHDML